MTDRELLELAAKAAGIEVVANGNHVRLNGAIVPMNNTGWNPLTDDGDALRLAVKLSINFGYYASEQKAIATCGFVRASEFAWSNGDDQFLTARRAIVRAAAEIGKETTK